MSYLPDGTDATVILNDAIKAAKDAKDKADSSSVGQTIKDKLYASSSAIQDKLDALLQKGGVITQEELDALDEQVRQAKKDTLEADSKASARKFGTYIIVGVAAIGILWFLANRKNKTP